MELRLNKNVYTVEDVVRTLYVFTDNAYYYVDETDEEILISIDEKKDALLKGENLVGEIKNELLAQLVRKYIRDNTRDIRNLIFRRAMASSLILESVPVVKKNDPDFEIDSILKDWFDNA